MHSSSHENQLSLNLLNFPTGHWSIAFRYVMNSRTLDSVRWCFPLELINCTLLCEPAEIWGKTACAGICFGSNNAIHLQKCSWQGVLKISEQLFSHIPRALKPCPARFAQNRCARRMIRNFKIIPEKSEQIYWWERKKMKCLNLYIHGLLI